MYDSDNFVVYRIKEYVGQTSYFRDGPPFATAEEAAEALKDDKAYIKDARRHYKIIKITEEVVELPN